MTKIKHNGNNVKSDMGLISALKPCIHRYLYIRIADDAA